MRALLVLAALLLAPLGAAAEVRFEQLESPALGAPLRYGLYLPPHYADDATRRYPVLYLLHGVGGNEHDWPDDAHLARIVDPLISTGAIRPLLIVTPAGDTSWYVDSKARGGPGDYATATAVDLVRHIDTTYRTIADRGGRAIGGLSMGGFGALRLGFEHPETYAAIIALSSALWSHVTDETTLTPGQEQIFQGSFGRPFDGRTFRAESPENAALIASVARLPQPPPIFLAAGDDDRFGAWRSTTALTDRLRKAGLAVDLRILDGGHEWGFWQAILPVSLVWLNGKLPMPGSP